MQLNNEEDISFLVRALYYWEINNTKLLLSKLPENEKEYLEWSEQKTRLTNVLNNGGQKIGT